jgi:hypothetical protein
MTELSSPDEYAAAQPSSDWPLNSQPEVTDRVIHQALAPLHALPGVRVADHEGVYNALHDELRAALDADPTVADPTVADPTVADSTEANPPANGPSAGGA